MRRVRSWLVATGLLAAAGIPLAAAAEEAPPEDGVITEKVEQRLKRDPFVERYDIEVETEDAVVFLRGHVSKENEKEQAAELARTVEGVERVENRLLVGPLDTDELPAVVPESSEGPLLRGGPQIGGPTGAP